MLTPKEEDLKNILERKVSFARNNGTGAFVSLTTLESLLELFKEPIMPSLAVVYPSFDDFWSAYLKKVDRKRCEKLWTKLVQKDKESIMLHVPEYVASTPEIRYRKDPATYLYNRSWENDIIVKDKPSPQSAWL